MSTRMALAWSPGAAGPLLEPEPDLSWRDAAECQYVDPEAFFPEKGGSVREAKRVCRSCEARVPCLEYALENDEKFGVWGGLSERERRRISRPAAPVMCRTGRHPKAGPGDCAECRKEREQKRRKTPVTSAPARSAAETPGRQKTGTTAVRAWRPQGTYGWQAGKKGIAA